MAKNTKPRAECQVCAREWALSVAVLGHHGYERPGIGYIVGDCAGQGWAPFPTTDALEEWLGKVNEEIAACDRLAAALPGRPVLTNKRVSKSKWGFGRMDFQIQTYIHEIRKADGFERHETTYTRNGQPYAHPRHPLQAERDAEDAVFHRTRDEGAYARELARQLAQVAKRREFFVGEAARVAARIAKGRALQGLAGPVAA
jgi:hypothetical protein